MDCILAAKLLKVTERGITMKNLVSVYDSIGASYVTEELESLVERIGESSLDDLISQGRDMMSVVTVPAAQEAAAPAGEEEPEKAEGEKVEEDDDDFDMFAGF